MPGLSRRAFLATVAGLSAAWAIPRQALGSRPRRSGRRGRGHEHPAAGHRHRPRGEQALPAPDHPRRRAALRAARPAGADPGSGARDPPPIHPLHRAPVGHAPDGRAEPGPARADDRAEPLDLGRRVPSAGHAHHARRSGDGAEHRRPSPQPGHGRPARRGVRHRRHRRHAQPPRDPLVRGPAGRHPARAQLRRGRRVRGRAGVGRGVLGVPPGEPRGRLVRQLRLPARPGHARGSGDADRRQRGTAGALVRHLRKPRHHAARHAHGPDGLQGVRDRRPQVLGLAGARARLRAGLDGGNVRTVAGHPHADDEHGHPLRHPCGDIGPRAQAARAAGLHAGPLRDHAQPGARRPRLHAGESRHRADLLGRRHRPVRARIRPRHVQPGRRSRRRGARGSSSSG